jgi:hypothetical protein
VFLAIFEVTTVHTITAIPSGAENITSATRKIKKFRRCVTKLRNTLVRIFHEDGPVELTKRKEKNWKQTAVL